MLINQHFPNKYTMKGVFIYMQTFEYTITDPLGMHARPAGLFVKEASSYESSITISKGGKTVDAKKIFGVMGLMIKNGDTVTIAVEGVDEAIVAGKMEAFMKETL